METPGDVSKTTGSAATSVTSKKAVNLIIDSGAIIKGADLASLAETFWTVPDVISEIRDERSRRMFRRLPFEVKTREPSAAAMNAVVDFSKKTGDYAFLSLPDLRVLALTYMIETEANGTSHLRTEPSRANDTSKVACKFYNGPKGCQYGDKCRFNHDGPGYQPPEPTEDATQTEETAEKPVEKEVTVEESSNTGESTPVASENTTESMAASTNEAKSRILGTNSHVSSVSAEEDDGKGWINASNSTHFSASPFGDGQNTELVHKPLTSACATTDFSMQNVMLQMGLNLLSTDGMRIRRVRQFLMRCAACFTTTHEMERMFCPKCGNATMERVAYSVDRFGQVQLHLRDPSRRPTRLAGTKYSIPKPKGGRHDDLLLREDQLLGGIWAQRQRQNRRVVQSAFGESVAKDLGVKAEQQAGLKVGYGRMNPNAQKGRERRGKKKRN